MKKLLVLTILSVAVFASDAFGQWMDGGKLNVWTSQTISRRNDDSEETTYLKEVRVAKNKAFDRVVFEFIGDIPRYQIKYVKPPIFGTADEEIKVSGKFFVDINLQSLPYPEDENFPDAKIPEGKLNLPVITEVKEIEWFEGVRPFAIGLNVKKFYHVQQLKNPTRLVIDFKH